jgi:hypothetical protein
MVVAIRTVGALMLMAAVLETLLILANAFAPASPRDLKPLIPIVLAQVVLGFGVVMVRRWAAVILGATLAVVAMVTIGGSLIYGVGPVRGIYVFFGLCQLAAVAVIASGWRVLR